MGWNVSFGRGTGIVHPMEGGAFVEEIEPEAAIAEEETMLLGTKRGLLSGAPKPEPEPEPEAAIAEEEAIPDALAHLVADPAVEDALGRWLRVKAAIRERIGR